ncbi:right-handed parallel beta-helix repeat-containing protein [Methanobrevibacter sp. OttesenSCG-928-K11]|nr:right-handed parallel beta-helix repeat-containing protein [Methanobrevibacter sp. OttesenSCG-928-K11]MDL2270702.1 right-handed parallel beta-helix repeat-containing protein [Methanobrevibacter sp. OttesenSCG-928-I08]
MYKKLIILISLVLAFSFFLNPTMATEINNETIFELTSENSIITVDGSAKNQMNNPTIQDAIDRANSGDTILITGTEYEHCHFVINKPLNIISEVGTTMSTCPSNTDGSNGVGIFYFGEGASGSVLLGFTLTNTQSKKDSVNPYSIYIKDNANVTIDNCSVKTTNGPGIYVFGTTNTLIKNSYITGSKNGILVERSNNTQIMNNNIEKNKISGINIGSGVSDSYIYNNTIYANNQTGIYFNSSVNAVVLNNRIIENRNDEDYRRADAGAGIYVNSQITNMKIIGNYFLSNGEYGIYNSINTQILKDQYTQIIDNNVFLSHITRVIYKNDNGHSGTVFVWSNYYSNEQFCPGTYYETGVLIGNHARDLILKITQIEKGVYDVSFIRKNDSKIANYLSSVDVTVFLNKVNTNPSPTSTDTYKIIRVVNGTAIVDFRDADFLPTENNLTAISPGNGPIAYPPEYADRLVGFLKINDSDIPNSSGTILNGNDLNLIYGEDNYYTVTLTDFKGNYISNKEIIFEVNGRTYKKITENGKASLKIALMFGTYSIVASFKGDNDYYPSTLTNIIRITESPINKTETTLKGNDFIQNFGDNKEFVFVLVDIDDNPLSNKNVIITINGKPYERVTSSDGEVKITIRLNPGTYTVKGEFLGDNNYLSSLTTNNIHVNDVGKIRIVTTLEGNDLKQIFGENKDYNVVLTTNIGQPLVSQSVQIIINGINYFKTTDENGLAKIAIRLNPGNYTVSSIYNGNDLYDSCMSSNKLIINESNGKLDVNIDFGNEKQKFGENKALTLKLTDEKSNALINQNIVIKVNNVEYKRTTDSSGIAKLIIRLNPGEYDFSVNYLGNSYYNPSNLENTIVVNENIENKISTKLEGIDLTQTFGENNQFIVSFTDNEGNNIVNQNIVITINGVDYIKTTDDFGKAKITIRLNPGIYDVKSEFLGTSLYNGDITENKLTVLDKIVISNTLKNSEIQNIINNAPDKSILIFDGEIYDNISLTINKPLKLYGIEKTELNGNLNQEIFNIKSSNTLIGFFILNTYNASGIIVENSENVEINGNTIRNRLDESKIEDFMKGREILPGNGIKIKNSTNITILNNYINLFYSGINLENSENLIINQNTLTKNNYGIFYDNGVSNTLVKNNDIIGNIGLITMEMVEGPLGYGIYMKNSAENVEIYGNNIVNNYIGIFIESKNSTGIRLIGNLISNSTLEGIVFAANYNYSVGATQPVVENNAIYNNAKGPGLIVLGEVSANPAGIYGPGATNNTLRLFLGANWYGENKYVIWGENGTRGAGTICPRINTTLITFEISLIEAGTYQVTFFNNEEIATLLPEFKTYFTLNYNTDLECEKEITITNGVGILTFDKECYNKTENIIEGTSGSLYDKDRTFRFIFTYNVPNSEIPI